jgi:DNA-binding CsgD family transcriptional regulator
VSGPPAGGRDRPAAVFAVTVQGRSAGRNRLQSTSWRPGTIFALMALQIERGPVARRCETHTSSGSRATPLALRSIPPQNALPLFALGSEGLAGSPCDLAWVWQCLLDAQLVFVGQGTGPWGRYALCRKAARPPTSGSLLNPTETTMLHRVLGGEAQKSVASDLGIACSTASKFHGKAIDKLHLTRRPIALPVVMAAQAWVAREPGPPVSRLVTLESGGIEYVLVTVPRPSAAREERITPAEREIAELLVDGQTKSEIAALRATSTHTIACQLRAIFRKLRAGGRCELIKRAVEGGWFG